MTSAKEVFYGKTKRIFMNPETINPHLYCSICIEVFELPNRLSCGHSFCYVCIQNWVKTHRKQICPECKADFSKRKLEKDLLASKIIDDLEVRCIHAGCKHICKNSVIKNHQRACQFRQKKNCNNIDGKVYQLDEQQEQFQAEALPVILIQDKESIIM